MIDIKVEMTGEGADVRLGGDATVAHGEELKQALISVLNTSPRVAIHTENVSDADLSCLQVLCSAHRLARFLNKKLVLTGPADGALEQAAKDLGYSPRVTCGRKDNENDLCLWTGGSHE